MLKKLYAAALVLGTFTMGVSPMYAQESAIVQVASAEGINPESDHAVIYGELRNAGRYNESFPLTSRIAETAHFWVTNTGQAPITAGIKEFLGDDINIVSTIIEPSQSDFISMEIFDNGDYVLDYVFFARSNDASIDGTTNIDYKIFLK
ncbi:MAG: hypothetical protein ATN36_05325 [Epulopiscium sp. Nele67-Bin005]|nr:MAG: hypothetical protein ATN36_05325 [Epulopiscium sp. Nele67-Bin005]